MKKPAHGFHPRVQFSFPMGCPRYGSERCDRLERPLLRLSFPDGQCGIPPQPFNQRIDEGTDLGGSLPPFEMDDVDR